MYISIAPNQYSHDEQAKSRQIHHGMLIGISSAPFVAFFAFRRPGLRFRFMKRYKGPCIPYQVARWLSAVTRASWQTCRYCRRTIDRECGSSQRRTRARWDPDIHASSAAILPRLTGIGLDLRLSQKSASVSASRSSHPELPRRYLRGPRLDAPDTTRVEFRVSQFRQAISAKQYQLTRQVSWCRVPPL